MTGTDDSFDALEKERQLQAESQRWDTRNVVAASPSDIPVIDIADWLATGSDAALQKAAEELGYASRNVGFYSLTGHGIDQGALTGAFALARRFHALPAESKQQLLMDQPDAAVAGAGYLPVKHRKLPRRATGNENEAFIVKRDKHIAVADNPWPDPALLPGFHDSVVALMNRLQQTAVQLLPLYATALGVERNFFAPGFIDPLVRLRFTHYPPVAPPVPESAPEQRFGIAPHVDTTFITLLAQDSPGLAVFSERRQCWIAVPLVEGALIVNTGELLKQWSNDEFISVKHFADNSVASTPDNNRSRYSIPFFVNAASDYPMACIPSCCGPDRPAKYPTISYNQSQGVVQGE